MGSTCQAISPAPGLCAAIGQPGDFVGGYSQDQPFVGGVQDDANGQQGNGYTPLTTGGWGGQGNPGYRQRANPNQSGGQGSTQQNAAASIRTTFRAAFNYPQSNPNTLSTTLTRRLATIPALQSQTPIRVELQGRTAILRGVAATEHDRGLAEQMLRLEPGIEEVKNEVAVASPIPPEPAAP